MGPERLGPCGRPVDSLRRFTHVALLLLLVACRSGVPAGYVSRDTYPEVWPFLPDAGQLRCDEGHGLETGEQYVTIEFDDKHGIWYALNGSARSQGLPELDEDVWNGDRAATLSFVERGLTLCD